MTSRLTQARPASRPALKARLMISGPTGAGKTWTGLKIAEVLAEGGKTLVIDTEKESALTYADNFSFVHLPWIPPYEPRELGRTIIESGREYAVVMVDSTSHFWRKAGGTLDIAAGKFTGWKDARPAQEDLVDAILGCAAHVILCTRSKMEHVQEKQGDKQVVRKLGMAPQQDDDLEYELNVAIELDMDHRATVSKSRCDDVEVGRSFTAGHEVELAGIYAEWLKIGEPAAPQDVVGELVARMSALPADRRVACKTQFVERVGRPDHLRESRIPEAEALVASFEAEETRADTGGVPSQIGAGEGDAEQPRGRGLGAAPESAPPPPPEPAEPDPVPSFIDPPDNPDAKDAGKPLPKWLVRLHVLTGETLGALPTAEITEKRRLIVKRVSGETKSSRDLTGEEREAYEEVLTQLREGTLEFVTRVPEGFELRRAVGGQDPATAPAASVCRTCGGDGVIEEGDGGEHGGTHPIDCPDCDLTPAAPALDLAGWKALAKERHVTQRQVLEKAWELSGCQEPSSLAGLVGHPVAGGVLAWLEGQ